MAHQWTTVEVLQESLAPPFTADQLRQQQRVVDAVCAFVDTVRPDLTTGDTPSPEVPTVKYAAEQLAIRWLEKRGAGLTASFAELGYIPGSVDKDIEQALRIGRYAGNVVA